MTLSVIHRRICKIWCGQEHVIVGVWIDRSLDTLNILLTYYIRFLVKTNGKVTALWPGSSLHYIQTLAEDRWEDYEWRYIDQNRFRYWGPGISWIEDPSIDPLGVDESDSRVTTATIPRRGDDISFYLRKHIPLPNDCSNIQP